MKTVKALVSQQGLSSLQRPRFSPGLLLEDEDLTAGVDYTRNMMRLLFRSLFGCGVICGLEVTAVRTCNRRKLKVSIDPGVALDCSGNPIWVPKAQAVTYDPDCTTLPDWIWVTVCYIEKCCRPKDVSCSPDDDSHVVQTRAYDGFEIKLYDQRPECACSCEAEAMPATASEHPAAGETGGATAGPTGATAAPPPAAGAGGQPPVAPGTGVAAGQPTVTAPTDGAPPAQAKPKINCACYDPHNKGVCACDCGCACVVIAKIHTTKGPNDAELATDTDRDVAVDADGSMRRSIRPILTGFLPCLKLATADDGVAAQPQRE